MTARSPTRIRAIIVDGEDHARRVLRALLASDDEVEVIDEAKSALEAQRKILELQPHLVFMDIGSPEGGGMQLPDDAEARPYLICVTTQPELALQAFERQADDFLVKPLLPQQFARSVNRAKQRIAERLVAGLALQIAVETGPMRRMPMAIERGPRASYPAHLMIRIRRRMFSLDVNDILWIEGASQYSRIHAREGDYLLSRTLGSLAGELDPEQFLRVHRSAIVNAGSVLEVRSNGDGRHHLVLRCGRILAVGRTRRAALDMLAEARRLVAQKKAAARRPPRVVLQGAKQVSS